MSHKRKIFSAERWNMISTIDQMANIGSEIERAFNWRLKNNPAYAQKSFERALELIDLTLDCDKNYAHLKEVARMREAIIDYFSGVNQFHSSESSWRKYFLPFFYASRKK